MQPSLLDELITPKRLELLEWIGLNPMPFEAIKNEFVRYGSSGRKVSVRDLWSWARMNYAWNVRPDGSSYSFNNNYTAELAEYLCELYPQYEHLVERRRRSADTENPSYE